MQKCNRAFVRERGLVPFSPPSSKNRDEKKNPLKLRRGCATGLFCLLLGDREFFCSSRASDLLIMARSTNRGKLNSSWFSMTFDLPFQPISVRHQPQISVTITTTAADRGREREGDSSSRRLAQRSVRLFVSAHNVSKSKVVFFVFPLSNLVAVKSRSRPTTSNTLLLKRWKQRPTKTGLRASTCHLSCT